MAFDSYRSTNQSPSVRLRMRRYHTALIQYTGVTNNQYITLHIPLMPLRNVPRAVFTGSAEPVPEPNAANVCISLPKLRPAMKKSSCFFWPRISHKPTPAIPAK